MAEHFFMLYRFAKILMTVGLRFFYRHIHVSGLQNIPESGPVVIIANHASSLMDAALIGILLKRPVHFFTRGDVFVNKPVRIILSWFHMLPVHNHLKGGKTTIDANEESFADGRRVLSRGGVVVFFPESTSHVERQLMTFRKGVFRLAFKFAEEVNFSQEIPIVPIGITYEHPMAGRTEVLVHAGKTLTLSSYRERYLENKAAALLRISKDAYEIMRTVTLHVENAKRLETAEYCLTLSRNNLEVVKSAWLINCDKRFQHEQCVCNKLNSITDRSFVQLEDSCRSYFGELKKHQLQDSTIAYSSSNIGWKKFMSKSCYIIYLFGLLTNSFPVFIARQVSDKKVYRKDFYSWVFVSCYSVLYFTWICILLAICIYAGVWYIAGLLFVVIPAGLFAYYYRGLSSNINQQQKLRALTSDTIADLKNMRSSISKILEHTAV